MVDIFDEVNDEIRQEKLANFWKENGTFIIVCVIAVILAVGGKSWWSHYQEDQNIDRTSQLATALQQEDPVLLEDFAEETGGNHQLIARLLSAGLTAENASAAEDTEKAVETWRAVAADRGQDRMYRDLAMLLAVGQQSNLEGADLDALLEDLEPMTANNRPYRASALELMAHLEASRGEYEQAMAHIDNLLENTERTIPPSLQSRAETLKQYYELQVNNPQAGARDEG